MEKKLKKTTWKDSKKTYDDVFTNFPELDTPEIRSRFDMQSLWYYQSDLLREKRFLELVWIHPNLTELMINGTLTTFFHIINGTEKKIVRDLIDTLNLQQKNRLLISLNIIDETLFDNLETWRTQRNSLIHKLMLKVKKGVNFEKECEQFCILGIDLQRLLGEVINSEIRSVSR